MSEILKLEDNAQSLLKKLGILLDNLSSNLSKEKTETALSDGYQCIQEIEVIIDQLGKTEKENNSQTNLLIIKSDLMQKKEKYEKIRKAYIINKNSQLIDISSTEEQEDNINENGDQTEQNDKNLEENIINKVLEENIPKDNNNNHNDEIFNVNKDMAELSEEYIYSRNALYKGKRRLSRCCTKIKNKFRNISPKKKYFCLFIISLILLIVCFIALFYEFFD